MTEYSIESGEAIVDTPDHIADAGNMVPVAPSAAQPEPEPGADAQGIDGAGEQPVATSAADASGVAQAGFVAAWPMGVAQ